MKNKFTLFFVLVLIGVSVAIFEMKKTVKVSSPSAPVKPEEVKEGEAIPKIIPREETELNPPVIQALELLSESDDDEFQKLLESSSLDYADQEKLRQNRGTLIKSLNERFKMFYENDKKQLAKMQEESSTKNNRLEKIDYLAISAKEFEKHSKDLPVIEPRKTPEEISKIKEDLIAKFKSEHNQKLKSEEKSAGQ